MYRVIIVVYQLLIFLYYTLDFFKKYFFTHELNLANRYGEGSYVVITGPSSGQGKVFAQEFAKRGFNLILIGSERTKNVEEDLRMKHKDIKIITIVKNFCNACEKDFFKEIEDSIVSVNGDISFLVNNISSSIKSQYLLPLSINLWRNFSIFSFILPFCILYINGTSV